MVERLGLEELRAVLSSIERALECSVCLETIRDAATVCKNGHGVCRKCGQQLNGSCPMCRSPFTESSAAMLNSIIREIPRPCQNESSGCDEMMLPSRERDHEGLCGYRSTFCWLKGCCWEGLVNDTLNHLQCDHPSTPLYTAANSVCRWTEINMKPDARSFIPIYAYSCIIWGRAITTKDSQIHLTFHLIPNGRLPSFRAVVVFKRGDLCGYVQVVNQGVNEEVPLADRVVLTKAEVTLNSTSLSGALVHSLSILKDS